MIQEEGDDRRGDDRRGEDMRGYESRGYESRGDERRGYEIRGERLTDAPDVTKLVVVAVHHFRGDVVDGALNGA